MLFPGDAAIMAHTQADLQAQMDKFASAYSSFGLAENVEDEPDIFVDNQKLKTFGASPLVLLYSQVKSIKIQGVKKQCIRRTK